MIEIIKAEWLKSVVKLNENDWMKRLAARELEIKHYKGFLLETYHHAGMNPQIQAYATMYLKGNPRDMVGMFYKHAISEIGHDLMALNDLAALGENLDDLKNTKPLPTTIAFNAFAIYLIQFINPVAYLGYLFHLEFLPTLQGGGHIESLKHIGVPDKALFFLEEHAKIDIGHNKLMEKYVKHLVKSDKDLEDVIFAAQASCQLHEKMLSDAFINGEKKFTNDIRGMRRSS